MTAALVHVGMRLPAALVDQIDAIAERTRVNDKPVERATVVRVLLSRVVARLPRDLVRRLDAIAKRTAVRRSTVVRVLLSCAVERLGNARLDPRAVAAATLRRPPGRGGRVERKEPIG